MACREVDRALVLTKPPGQASDEGEQEDAERLSHPAGGVGVASTRPRRLSQIEEAKCQSRAFDGSVAVQLAKRIRSEVSSQKSMKSGRSSVTFGTKSVKSEPSMDAILTAKVTELLTFEGYEDILRGTSLSATMGGFCRIFANSGGSEETFALSRVVKTIDTFVSHNWVTPRLHKFVILALRFNLRIATVVGIVTMVVVSVLACFQKVPVVSSPAWDFPRTYIATVSTVPAVLCTLAFLRDLPRPVINNQRSVFLDKVCISQTNMALQARCIQKLGAFLCYSDEMLVIYTPNYLKKLWTVYEVACFMSLHPLSKMRIFTPVGAWTFIGGIFCAWAINVVVLCRHLFIEGSYGAYVDYLLVFCLEIAYLACARKFARNKSQVLTEVVDFSVHATGCFCAADRPVVYQNIVELMKQVHPEVGDTTDDQCLEVFNQMVRSGFHQPFLRSMGRFLLTYEQTLLLSFFMWAPKLVDCLGGIGNGVSLANFAPLVVWYIMTVGFITPFYLFLLGLIAGMRVHLRGLASFMLLTLMMVGKIILILVIMVVVDVWLYGWATRSHSGLATFAAVAIFSSVILAVVLTSPSCIHLSVRARSPTPQAMAIDRIERLAISARV